MHIGEISRVKTLKIWRTEVKIENFKVTVGPADLPQWDLEILSFRYPAHEYLSGRL